MYIWEFNWSWRNTKIVLPPAWFHHILSLSWYVFFFVLLVYRKIPRSALHVFNAWLFFSHLGPTGKIKICPKTLSYSTLRRSLLLHCTFQPTDRMKSITNLGRYEMERTLTNASLFRWCLSSTDHHQGELKTSLVDKFLIISSTLKMTCCKDYLCIVVK